MISAQYLSDDRTNCVVTLEPGDSLGSLHVQGRTIIPAYTIPAHTVPGFELDGVSYPARFVQAEEVPETVVPGGVTTPHTVPCREENPAWVALKLLVDAGDIVIADPPEAPTPVTVVAKLDLYRRMTEDEADAVEELLAQQTVKMRRTFDTAQTFRSDAPEWVFLLQMANSLFKPARVAQLLAPSV